MAVSLADAQLGCIRWAKEYLHCPQFRLSSPILSCSRLLSIATKIFLVIAICYFYIILNQFLQKRSVQDLELQFTLERKYYDSCVHPAGQLLARCKYFVSLVSSPLCLYSIVCLVPVSFVPSSHEMCPYGAPHFVFRLYLFHFYSILKATTFPCPLNYHHYCRSLPR